MTDAELDELQRLARERHAAGNGSRLKSRTILASEIEPEQVEFIDHERRYPVGMPTLAVGAPGVGKSTALVDLVARVSREGKAVVYLTGEDHLAGVVRPRLEAARAELDLVHVVVVDVELPESVGMLEEIVLGVGASLFIMDPAVAFMSDATNTHRDHHVRRTFAPLHDMAERCRLALAAVVHTNKAPVVEPLARIGGSIGFPGAARSVVLFAQDPSDDGRRIMATVKSNVAAFAPPLAYRIVPVTLRGNIETSRVEWLGPCPEVDVGTLLAQQRPEDRTAVDEAADFLVACGVLELARPARELYIEAEAEGIDRKALQRARRRLGADAWRDGFQSPFYWGPKPGNLDTLNLDTPTLSTLSRLDLPAETDPSSPNVDNPDGRVGKVGS